MRVLFLSLSLSLSPSLPTHSSTLFSSSLGFSCYLINKNGAVTLTKKKKETPGVTGKFGLGIRNEAEQRLIEFSQENALVYQTPSSKNTREDSIHGHHQMVNTEIRLIIFFAAKDGEALYSQ